MLNELYIKKEKIVNNNNYRFIAHHYKAREANKMEEKESKVFKELNKVQEGNSVMLGITIPDLEYRLANVY